MSYSVDFEQLTNIDSIHIAWCTFKKGKRKSLELLIFEMNLEENLIDLSAELKSQRFVHGKYTSFKVFDPKERLIHKAAIKDRLVHHLVLEPLRSFFDKTFIYHSYSGRKGTHAGVRAAFEAARRTSRNFRKPCYSLKLDIRKFYDSVDRDILYLSLQKRITNQKFLWLLRAIIFSFDSGMPIGNVTSQIFGNIYLDKLDKYIKHQLRFPNYFRYADDMLFLHKERGALEDITSKVDCYLKTELGLSLHQDKIHLRSLKEGIDFLGYVILPHHLRVRTNTKRRIFKKLSLKSSVGKISSYLGIFSHANEFQASIKAKNLAFCSNC